MSDGVTVLYRHYDADGGVLYVGITFDPSSRRRQHASDKPWWPLVARTTYEWHPTRLAALGAERAAIATERPTFNVIHNGAVRDVESPPMAGSPMTRKATDRIWRVQIDEYVQEIQLWLEWEIDCSAIGGNYSSDEISANDMWRMFIDMYYPDRGWAPIFWMVSPIHETAPFQAAHSVRLGAAGAHGTIGDPRGMLREYQWPVDAETGERLNFMSLPVKESSWFVEQATGWKPSPLEPMVSIAMLDGGAPRGLPWVLGDPGGKDFDLSKMGSRHG
jgi:hypothetical protein